MSGGDVVMKGLNVEEVESTQKTKRIAVHTHIKGLGLDDSGEPLPISQVR